MSELERANKCEIEKIELSPDEIEEAIKEAKIKKYFHVKHKEYWDKQEGNDHFRNIKP